MTNITSRVSWDGIDIKPLWSLPTPTLWHFKPTSRLYFDISWDQCRPLHSFILTIIKSAVVTLLPWKVSHEPNVNFVESTAVENSLLIKMFCMEGVLSFCYSLQNWIVGTLKWETCENMISGDKWALEIYWRWKERDKVYQQTPRSGKSRVFIKRKWRHNLGKGFLKRVLTQ